MMCIYIAYASLVLYNYLKLQILQEEEVFQSSQAKTFVLNVQYSKYYKYFNGSTKNFIY